MKSFVTAAVLGALVLGTAVGSTGCVRACDAAKAYISTLEDMATEAEAAIYSAERVLMLVPISDEDKATVNDAFVRAKIAITKSRQLLASAQKTCSAPSAGAVFEFFNDAWSVIKMFLPLVADPGAADAGKMSYTPIVKDPSCYQLRKQ